jgi:subtilisin family serine protease
MRRNSFSNRLLCITALIGTASLLFLAYACNEMTGVVDADRGVPTKGDFSSSSRNDSVQGYLIGFYGNPDEDLIRGFGGSVLRAYKNANILHINVPEQAFRELENNENVKFIEHNGIAIAMSDLDNHHYCSYDDYVCAEGDFVNSYYMSRIGAHMAWGRKITGKKDIRLAILAGGIDVTHNDIKIDRDEGVSFITEGPPSEWHQSVDLCGHCTHVAGIAGANGRAHGGLIGVAPDVTLVPVKILGPGRTQYWSTVIAGIDWSISNKIKIINMPLGGTYSRAVEEIVDAAWDAGILLVAAAGNRGEFSSPDVVYPAALDKVIAVSAANRTVDGIADFSSRGPEVELIAPGQFVYSTVLGNGYGYWSGTSMASAYVAGVAGLVWSNNTNLTNMQVRTRLTDTAEDLLLDRLDQGSGLVRADKALGINENGTGIPPFSFTIFATAGEGGTIEPSGKVIVPEGGSISFSITPDDYYVIKYVLVDDVPEIPAKEYNFTNVRDNHTINVIFWPGENPSE